MCVSPLPHYSCSQPNNWNIQQVIFSHCKLQCLTNRTALKSFFSLKHQIGQTLCSLSFYGLCWLTSLGINSFVSVVSLVSIIYVPSLYPVNVKIIFVTVTHVSPLWPRPGWVAPPPQTSSWSGPSSPPSSALTSFFSWSQDTDRPRELAWVYHCVIIVFISYLIISTLCRASHCLSSPSSRTSVGRHRSWAPPEWRRSWSRGSA